MTFSLSQIKRTRSDLPPRTVVHALRKVGKSTFASCAPRPIIIQTEDGLDNIEADAFPLCKGWSDVTSAVESLLREPHDFKTVVLDSVDWSEGLLHKAVAEEHKVASIEAMGYGKGYVYAAEKFSALLDKLNDLRIGKGMGVVMLCHSEIKRFDDPLSNSYDRYVLALHKQVAATLEEWADVIGYAAIETLTATEKKADFAKTERTRAMTTGNRYLHLTGSPAFTAGNRYSLPDKIEFTWLAYQDALDVSRGLKRLEPVTGAA